MTIGKKIITCFALLAFIFTTLYGHAQSFNGAQKLQGYAIFGNKVTFIFDEEIYQKTPRKVTITGEFRKWNQNMDTPAWQLKKTGTQWLLTIDNTDQQAIQSNTKFKYRIDNGEWLAPPASAKNKKGSDLIFAPQKIIAALKAELRNEHLIWAEVKAPKRPLLPSDYKIVDAQGRSIPVAGVLPHGAFTTLIRPAKPLNKKQVYFLEVPSLKLKTHCSFDGWFREAFSTKELGANIDNGKTTIRIFSPRAHQVKLYLYKGRLDQQAYQIKSLKQDKNGVWEIVIPQDLHGVYYDFTIHGAKEPGNHFYETNPVHITDPYARVSDDTWGKARIWRRTQPAQALKQGIPKMEDVIAYEVHVQDFTDLLPVKPRLKGTLKAMTIPGLRNKQGQKIGFDYLVDLGINTVHLMPVQEYVHFPTNDWKVSFGEDAYMKSQGISEENYQWGYRTSHAFAIESRYRSKGSEPGKEREEFRDLVQAFHDKGIAVIIDIVPNHTAENMDGNFWSFHFNVLDKLYYYRTKNFKHIGAYGNEVKTENRPMVQRWLIDQCQHFIKEFGIDGFRIDLAGQVDQQTLKALKAAIGEDKIVYGEAWIGSNDPNFENNPDWDWYKKDAPITFFQDDSRNAFKGPVFELKSKKNDRGWPGGKYNERPKVMKGLANKFPEDKNPLSGISYLDIHDNFALADQFGKNFDGRLEVDQNLYKIAVTLLYTTLGPIVTHGGSEIMRSKAAAPLKEVVKQTNKGFKVYMHGYRDTYNHRNANHFLWQTVGQRPQGNNKNDYANMYKFWQGMNAFRLSKYGRVFRVAQSVATDYYQWIAPKDQESVLGYVVDKQVLVLLNAGDQAYHFKGIDLPPGQWKLIANTKAVNHTKGVKDKRRIMRLKGGKKLNIDLDQQSLMIWVKE